MKKIIILSAILALVATGCSLNIPFAKNTVKILTVEEAKAKAEKFVNENLLEEGTKATIKEVKEANGLYSITLEVGGRDYTSYMTKDGTKFFQSGLDIAEVEKQAQAGSDTEPKTTVTKSDKPSVELFVMSYCPYGTQIEKGIIPAIQTLGSKIDFSLKFCDYAMHGDKELNENLTQYCIQKEQSGKLISYLQCFLKAGDQASCLTQTGIDKNKLSSCVSATDKEFKVTEKSKDKNTWTSSFPPFDVFKADNQKYGVQGSPTLVINGAQVSSGRDADALLKTICSAFNTAPEECNKQLSQASPAAGFGEGTAATTDANAGCATQ